MIFEPVLALGWKDPGSKPGPLLVLYCGDDVESAQKACDAALDSGVVSFARVVRGPFPGGGQLMAASSPTHRYEPPGPLIPATGR